MSEPGKERAWRPEFGTPWLPTLDEGGGMYGKQTECAIAALSRLAEVYDGGVTKLSAVNIADARGLPRPFVSKMLAALSQAGLVEGCRGPGGGFYLSRSPHEIKLHDVYCLFETHDRAQRCPFGGPDCGGDGHCPLHDKISALHENLDVFLLETTFGVFFDAANEPH